MKTMFRFFWITAITVIIVVGFNACGDAETGPMGPKGDTGLPGQNAIAAVDANGTTIGTVIDVNARIITNGNYTFPVSFNTGEIGTGNLWATAASGEGTLILPTNGNAADNVFLYPNFVYRNGDEGKIYRPKDRDQNGYPTNLETRTPQSWRQGAASTWNSSSLGESVTIEIEETALTTVQIIGFTPSAPIRFVWN